MDAIKILLGATCALLLVAVVASWQNMSKGVLNAPPDELERLRKQVAELRQEQDKLLLEKQLQEIRATTPAVPTPATNAAEIDAMKAKLEEKAKVLEELEKEKAERDAKLAVQEEGLIDQRDLERGDSELRRARLIADAILIGKVREVVDDAEFGGFITFDVVAPSEVTVEPGVIVAVRRKTGLLNQYKVSEITPEGAIANPLPGFGSAPTQPGDELIFPPPF